MQELARIIAQVLVDDPEAVSVSTLGSDNILFLRLKVGQGEAGKIIGKQGRTIDAFRTILNAAAARMKKRIILEIADDADHAKHQLPVKGPSTSTAHPLEKRGHARLDTIQRRHGRGQVISRSQASLKGISSTSGRAEVA